MALKEKLVAKLNKKFAVQARIEDNYQGKDIIFLTNELGEAVTLFICKRRQDGAIVGERYARRIVRESNSDEILKSHWDLKGKVSRSR